MKESIYNYDNISDDEIDEVVNRVKVLLINKNKELLLGYSHGVYQFIGGHVEENEYLVSCIKREIKEETGIELDIQNIEPYMVLKHYNKNYHNSNKNRLSVIYYYFIKCDEKYNINNVNYTEDEKEGNFELRYVNINELEKVLIDNIPNNEINKIIAYEMIEAINEYKRCFND